MRDTAVRPCVRENPEPIPDDVPRYRVECSRCGCINDLIIPDELFDAYKSGMMMSNHPSFACFTPFCKGRIHLGMVMDKEIANGTS